MTADGDSPVSKRATCLFPNRPPPHLSAAQVQIMRFLVSKGDVDDHLTTGRIAEAIGRRRDNAGYASVNRSLIRLWRAGFVVVFEPGCRQWGSAFFYWARDEARAIDWGDAE